MANRAKEVADNDFPSEVRWIRGYRIAEHGGSLASICTRHVVYILGSRLRGGFLRWAG